MFSKSIQEKALKHLGRILEEVRDNYVLKFFDEDTLIIEKPLVDYLHLF